MKITAELILHDVSTLTLDSEALTSRWVDLTLNLGSTQLTIYFDVSRAGLTSWQQLRQGLARASDYVLMIENVPIRDGQEHAVLEWLANKRWSVAS